jgi:uncharacterized lipoprotein YmbA
MKLHYTTLLCAVVLFTGCSSKSNFYQLHSATTPKSSSTNRVKSNIIGIAEVEVPEYLDKPQIITRMNDGRVDIHETERWAGSFPGNIQTVLTHNLSRSLPAYTFLSAPWEEPVTDKYRIYLNIDRFDGDRNGTVVLEGRWSLVDKDENRMLTGEHIYYIEKGGATLDETVTTQSRLLERLSRAIARKIRRYL